MLSDAVMQHVGDRNPVVVAAQAQGFDSDVDFLHHAADEKGVIGEVRTSLIGAYEESRDQSKPNIPYFAFRAIEQAFPSKLPEKREQVRATHAAKQKLQKQPPRQCKPTRR